MRVRRNLHPSAPNWNEGPTAKRCRSNGTPRWDYQMWEKCVCHSNFVHDSSCVAYTSRCHMTTEVACQFTAWRLFFFFSLSISKLVSCTSLTISVLSLDVSALMFNSKLDNCTVSKDCEFRCFSWHGQCINIVLLTHKFLYFTSLFLH